MAITLTVVEPTSNGIGADAFALVWDGKLHGLNASVEAPALTPELLPQWSEFHLCWLSVTVPGAVSAWRCLWGAGSCLEQPFEPAGTLLRARITYNRTGLAASRGTYLPHCSGVSALQRFFPWQPGTCCWGSVA